MADMDANNNNDTNNNEVPQTDGGNNEAAPKAESITLKLVMNNGDETMFKVGVQKGRKEGREQML